MYILLIKPKEYKDYSPADILNLSAQRTPMSPADSADDAEECSKLHYYAEKDRLGFVYLEETT